jgi:MoaA/NifB/PqqE/SkfB family radical SAM enzyme
VLSKAFRPGHVPLFVGKYAWLKVRRMPVLVSFEVTQRCNARCSFCDYWKTDASAKETELKSFADAAKFFNPMIVTFTGGEPTLRRDLEELVSAVSKTIPLTYITLLTHGAMLTVDRARALQAAGVHQLSISLDYLDERHDIARGIPGLVTRLFSSISDMRDAGIDNVRFNTVIKNDNVDQVMPIIRRAADMGYGVNLSVYTDSKNGNRAHLIPDAQVRDVERLIAEVLAFKRKNRHAVSNSEYYLEQIPRYLRGEMREPCRSGMRTVHIDPLGNVKRCPDFPTDFHWRDFKRYKPIDCNACFYACRGEAEAPLRLSRAKDMLA